MISEITFVKRAYTIKMNRFYQLLMMAIIWLQSIKGKVIYLVNNIFVFNYRLKR